MGQVVAGALVAGGLAACGDGGEAADAGRPNVVVTTTVLGDLVAEVVGEKADVEVIMPAGADPHDFAPSTRQAEAMERADLLVVNGAGFEEGLHGIIESARAAGTPVFTLTDHVDLLELGAAGEPADTASDDTAGAADPHVWTDPSRMATAVVALADRVATIEGVDAAAVESQATAYAEELGTLDATIEHLLAPIPAERRVIVTNHEVFGYFAKRYDFEVVGAVIPSLTTRAGASAADVEALADVIRDRGVPVIFGETSQSTRLADALAAEVGGEVDVVELFTESLGPSGSGAETYVQMMQLNAERIAGALS